jgi:hypothetical protein
VLGVGKAAHRRRSGRPRRVAAAGRDRTGGRRGQRAVGAARGALGGLAIGAIAGDAGRGAGIGAVVGTMAGGRQARLSQSAQSQQAVGAQQQALNTYHRAFAACLEGRGYTIK